jgi:hypothetical protein
MKYVNLVSSTIITALASVLIGCSGGGSDSSASNAQTPVNVADYSPDNARLSAQAEGSSDLYVDEQFKFDHRVTTTLIVSAADENGAPITNARLSVYRVMTDLEEWSDEHLDEIEKIAVGVTDTNGYFQRTLELINLDQKLLLELNTTRLENKALISVSPNETRYAFEAQRR